MFPLARILRIQIVAYLGRVKKFLLFFLVWHIVFAVDVLFFGLYYFFVKLIERSH